MATKAEAKDAGTAAVKANTKNAGKVAAKILKRPSESSLGKLPVKEFLVQGADVVSDYGSNRPRRPRLYAEIQVWGQGGLR